MRYLVLLALLCVTACTMDEFMYGPGRGPAYAAGAYPGAYPAYVPTPVAQPQPTYQAPVIYNTYPGQIQAIGSNGSVRTCNTFPGQVQCF